MTHGSSHGCFLNSKYRYIAVPVAILLVMPCRGVGQPFADHSSGTLPDTLSLGFERNLNTFVWNGLVGAVIADSNRSLTIHQSFQSKLIRTAPVATQGEYDGSLGYRERIVGGVSVVAKTASLVVSDNQSIDLSQLAQHQGYLGLGLRTGLWNIEALGGYEVDAQLNAHDEGPAFDVSLESGELHLQQIAAALKSDWTKSYLGRRSPEQEGAILSVMSDFGGGDSDSLSAFFSGQRREFYTSADPALQSLYSIDYNIFRRDASTYGISDRLLYHLSGQTAITVRGSVQNRTIDRSFRYKNFLQPTTITLDTRIQELLLDGSAALSSQMFDWLRGSVGMSFQEHDERFSVTNKPGVPSSVLKSQQESARRLEYTSQRTSLWGEFFGDLSSSDRLYLNGSASILRYDTPDSMNTDDRDELLFTVSARETHDFNEYLSLGLEANVTLSHLVYLDRLQSANNNWNRVLAFSPSIVLRPAPWVASYNEGSVLANYTVYDFEEQVASVKSYSFRQATWTDSTTVNLSRKIDISFSGTLRAYERGILRWKEFKEKPLDYFVEKSVWPQAYYSMSDNFRLAVGYRLFSRDQYTYSGADKSLTHTIVTDGPTTGIEWYGEGGTRVLVSGWRQASTVDSGQTTYVSNVSVNVNFMF